MTQLSLELLAVSLPCWLLVWSTCLSDVVDTLKMSRDSFVVVPACDLSHSFPSTFSILSASPLATLATFTRNKVFEWITAYRFQMTAISEVYTIQLDTVTRS